MTSSYLHIRMKFQEKFDSVDVGLGGCNVESCPAHHVVTVDIPVSVLQLLPHLPQSILGDGLEQVQRELLVLHSYFTIYFTWMDYLKLFAWNKHKMTMTDNAHWAK